MSDIPRESDGSNDGNLEALAEDLRLYNSVQERDWAVSRIGLAAAEVRDAEEALAEARANLRAITLDLVKRGFVTGAEAHTAAGVSRQSIQVWKRQQRVVDDARHEIEVARALRALDQATE